MHSKGVWGLNMDITTSLRLGHTPILHKANPALYRGYRVRAPLYYHPCHIKVLKHFF